MTDGFKMGFINSEGKIEEIPKEYQEIIEHRDQLWIDMIKEIENKVGMVLDQLALTEKALELACEEVLGSYCSDYCGTEKDCENCWWRDFYTAEHFKTKAKEMMKSDVL